MRSLQHLLLRSKRGSVIALVMGFGLVCVGMYFGMQAYLSNRSLQIYRMTEALELASVAQNRLLEAVSTNQRQRVSATHTSWTTKEAINQYTVTVYVDERRLKTAQLVPGADAGRHYLLESIVYLTVACGRYQCQGAWQSEAFAPWPLMAAQDYLAWDTSVSLAAQTAQRRLGPLLQLSSSDIRIFAGEGCEKLDTKECRIRLFDGIMEQLAGSLQAEFVQRALRRRFLQQPPNFQPSVPERTMQAILESYSDQKSQSQPALEMAAASFYRLQEFVPPGVAIEQVSLREISSLAPDWQNAVQPHLKQYYPNLSFKPIPQSSGDLYFAQTSAIAQYLLREKIEAVVYKSPQTWKGGLEYQRGYHAFALKYSGECIPKFSDLAELQNYMLRSPANSSDFPEGCDSSGQVQVTAEEPPQAIVESPVLYIKEKPWLSLRALQGLLDFLAGQSAGEFPEDTTRSAQRLLGHEQSGNRQSGVIVVTDYTKTP